ncbi:MAG: Si-specific NAD(P)(+) transhydrogenase [Planctomycetota bacterium]
MADHERYDFIVIGGGPAGQAAAIQAARHGKSVLLVDKAGCPGGECVRHGTIPSKALQEAASAAFRAKRSTAELFRVKPVEEIPLASLMHRVRDVVVAHERTVKEQVDNAGVEFLAGEARLVSAEVVEVSPAGGKARSFQAGKIVVAAGSRPRRPSDILVDHENIVDSDSVLSLQYLPKSMVVLGAGVIACEYATIFAHLGVQIDMVDRGSLPLGFLDPELSQRFLSSYEASGGRFHAGRQAKEVIVDDFAHIKTTLDDGTVIESEKALFSLGRVAHLVGMGLSGVGVAMTARGLIEVNDAFQTNVPNIYAIGDVIGPPSLAASAMDQGRRAVLGALGHEEATSTAPIPVGIYAIPEVATVGLSETAVVERDGAVMTGRAHFADLARGQIAGNLDGMLKLIADRYGRKLLGVEVIGEGATELIHMGQMAILAGVEVDTFVQNVFNFPTLAEGYRVAALDIVEQRQACEMILV